MKPRFFLRSGNVEQRLRRLEWMSALAVAGCVISAAVAVFAFAAWETDAQTSPMPQALRVSELVVVDPKGVERVRIGGDLPDATINGKRVPRGEKAAGVLLYDGSGQERSGYVTFEPSGRRSKTWCPPPASSERCRPGRAASRTTRPQAARSTGVAKRP